VSETTVAEPVVVEEQEAKPGYAGQNVPRKEDKRLVQGEGVFFDDVKRHTRRSAPSTSRRRSSTPGCSAR
jgi:hypothetical protein